ncbi:ATP-dependent DNA helicase [Eubacterium ramulus]|uniref:Probable ATP-dependent helicase dinG homolog n=1 Tax=Eubacterium ramulus TaxID=39490 RepID=A0A173S6P5_EUBRA|nr:ATP-dependent DNA helicase [Eubacterium ramulus]CUM86154.1 Probable ATP-dependent helicase dinG homolog [Eubacterium ramulus]
MEQIETIGATEQRELTRIRISVRNLVEFIFRSGDIDNRIGKGAQKEAMQEGSRMHRKIQGRMGMEYRAEVPLKLEVPQEQYVLALEGRADGIITNADGVTVDEIKCMYTDVTRFEEPIFVHKAQAMCYAYIYALQNGLDQISVQLTYCDLDTEEICRFEEAFSFFWLERWFQDMMEAYRKWTDFQFTWRKIRQTSIQTLEFPFPYREGQYKLVGDVYRTIHRKKILFIQAPTGTGKTISTLFPAIRAVGENLGDKIFYLTAKTITRTVAKDTCDLLKAKGYRGKVIVLTAKEKMCPCEEMDCNPSNCLRAKGHYDRVNDAVYDLITTEEDFTRERMLAQAEKYQVCPFEMSLDASLYADIIICDYNYVFDPNVYLKRFFSEEEKGDYIFLVDEAHNLVERGREMYSAVLVKEEILTVKKLVRGKDRKLEAALEKCNRQMLEWKRECETYTIYESIGAFAFSLMRLMSLLDIFLQSRGEMPERKEVTEFYLNLRHFMNMFERVDENYVLYSDFDETDRFCLHLYCVNPSVNLQECLERGKSTIFFSATLLPVNYYKNLLSSKKDNYAVYADSAFREEQRLLFIGRDVSSLYTRRTLGEFHRIALYIQQVLRAKKGNYLIFFPSYRFMEDVYEQFLAVNEQEADCMMQSGNMNEADREEFIQEFSNPRGKSLAAFCVLGGIFSEGIDLKEDLLIGVLIVGTGLPQICNQREILKEYYQEENGQGFDYAYQYPGMNKVLQAAGRVIRTASDRGIIGLLDERFLRSDYRKLFPREWSQYEVHTLDSLPEALEAFWNLCKG